MTAFALPSNYGLNLAFDEKIRTKLNRVIGRLDKEVFQFISDGIPDSQLVVDQQFDVVIGSANTELKKVSKNLLISLDHTLFAIKELDHSINIVKAGDSKLFPDNSFDFIASICRAIIEQLIISIVRTRKIIENSNINRAVLGESLSLLINIEEDYRKIYNNINEIAEKIAIRDALTEEPKQITGNAELDALCDN